MNNNLNMINDIVNNYSINIKIFKFGKNLAFLIGTKLYEINDESLKLLNKIIMYPFKIEFIGAKKKQINYIINYFKSKNDIIDFVKYYPNENKLSIYDKAEVVLAKKENLINYDKTIFDFKDKDRVLSERKVKQLLKKKNN